MKRTIIVCLAVWALGCETTNEPPQIAVDILPVILPVQQYPEAADRRFDLQIRNIGWGTLQLENVRIKGDPRCAFEFEGPDETELSHDQSTFIRGWYAPPGFGNDVVMLEIESNSEEEDELQIPICGRAIETVPTEDDFIEACDPVDSSVADCGDHDDLV